MARNHHRFIEATLACSKLGANALYMNTGFAKRQFTEVVEREDPSALIYDDEFAEVLSDAREKAKCFVAWRTPGTPRADDPSLEELIEANDVSDLDGPDEPSRFVILTSGTTGAPKGAQRAQPDTLGPLAALFSRIPLRAQEPVMIAAPLFHSWGFAHFTLGLSLGSTYVLRRRFDPEQTLEAIAESRATDARRRPGDDAAHPRARRRRDLEARRLVAARHRGERLGAAGRARDALDGHVRRQPLQPLRLDRGRLGDDRDPRGPARGAGDGGTPAARHQGQDRRRGRQGRRAGKDRPRLRRQRDVVRGLHRRRRPRRSSTACCRAATSGTSTTTGGCSSTAATTT